tara:strand:- start:1046 stop:1180 length:135 start_codon:yes stop_codon:yes gene_type:complete
MSHIDFEEIPMETVETVVPDIDFTSIYLGIGAIFFFVMFIKSLK